jgi:hypothetical protein
MGLLVFMQAQTHGNVCVQQQKQDGFWNLCRGSNLFYTTDEEKPPYQKNAVDHYQLIKQNTTIQWIKILGLQCFVGY